ncbi:Glycosyltransferase involved in cell wall bisynthesis [Candidatus Methanophagaceae archaeon]|nr:Glycosyltransferase involved in cell wall bisynthesis [Methanophagales archaeon]
MKIGWIEIPKGDALKTGGGNAWRIYLYSLLSKKFDIEPMGLILEDGNKIFQGGRLFYNLLKLKGNKDLWIREFSSTITLPFDKTTGKNLLIVHHIDSNYLAYPTLCKFLDKLFYRNLNEINTVVTVSKFWKEHFESRGCDDVRLIYNFFDITEFEFTEEEIVKFKETYGLTKRPIVYLGNCQKAKGVVEAYQALKGLDADLVTSGEKRVDIPATNLNLSYRDYLRLLKAASVVVTMSKFKEGWCRTAHEAMLCKTPVVGSGNGGMAELLEGGGQIVCKDFSELREKVEYAMEHPELGENGYEYASQEKFTLPHFEKEWVKLIEEMGG